MKKTRKLSKGKLFIAIIAITLVASMIMAGTYAWFVRTADVQGIESLNAAVTAAYIDDVGFEITANIEQANIINIYKDVVDPVYRNDDGSVPETIWNRWLPLRTDFSVLDSFEVLEPADFVDKVIYPSEGVRFTLEYDLQIVSNWLLNNREVVVGIDLSELFTALNAIEKELKDAAGESVVFGNHDDILFSKPANLAAEDGFFYYYLEAREELDISDIEALLDGIIIDFGIIGHAYNQNHYMNGEFKIALPTTDAKITIVQATEQAVRDVFGIDIDDVNGVNGQIKEATLETLFDLAVSLIDDYSEANHWDPHDNPAEFAAYNILRGWATVAGNQLFFDRIYADYTTELFQQAIDEINSSLAILNPAD